jgi:hypothetical protein
MTDRDIVTRLRAVLHNDRSVELMNREAADEIERLQKIVAEYDRVRVEYLAAWEKWIKHHSDEDVVEWLRWYASEHPVSRPDGNAIEAIHCAIDKRCREAADEIEAQRVQINDLQFELKDLRKFRLEVLREAINCIPAIPSIAFSSTTQAGGRAR